MLLLVSVGAVDCFTHLQMMHAGGSIYLANAMACVPLCARHPAGIAPWRDTSNNSDLSLGCATMPASLGNVEAALRAAISERLGQSRFSLWFGDAVRLGLSGDGNSLEVRVPNAFFADWIRGHYASSLVDAATTVIGRSLQLSIQLNDELAPLG